MMDQLGIKALRPGPSGDEKAPNHANYDESLANPFPNLPDPLTLKNGQKVTTPDMWWKQRRPEIVEDFEREVYGRVPINVQNLPQGVRVLNIGLNGVLITEAQTERNVFLQAEPWARPMVRPFYAVAKAEAAGTDDSSPPIELVVEPAGP